MLSYGNYANMKWTFATENNGMFVKAFPFYPNQHSAKLQDVQANKSMDTHVLLKTNT